MASNEYKLSVVEGTQLTLSLNAGLQGPAGPIGPAGPTGASASSLSTLSDVDATDLQDGSFLYWDDTRTKWVADSNTTVSDTWIVGSNSLVRPNTGGWLQTPSLQIFNVNNANNVYAQLNSSPSATTSTSFTLPATSGTIATNNSAVMLTGNQNDIQGDKTFKGQIQLNNQILDNGYSAVTRDLADARYGVTFVGIKTENVSSTDNIPIKLTSVTLPVGMYQIDSNISATAANPNGGYVFGLRADKNIRFSLFEQYGSDGLATSNNVAASDSSMLTQRAITGTTSLTSKRQLMGLLEVITDDTEVSLEFCQSTTTPLSPNVTRKRAYIIARKIS